MSELESSGKPNLTPILDMVFQLITFFIMLASFRAVSIEASLNLPVVGSAKPVDTQGQNSLVILNIDETGDLKVYGESKPIASYIAEQAWVELLAARMNRDDLAAGKELPTIVVVRADRSTPFKLLNRVLQECQKNGFRRFALKAWDKER